MGMVFLPNRFGKTGSLSVQSVSKNVTAPRERSISQQKTSKSPNQEEKEQQQRPRRWRRRQRQW